MGKCYQEAMKIEKAIKGKYNYVSYSGGKDSTAMLFKLLEDGVKIDKVIFADTGFEFPELYIYMDRVDELLKEYNLKIERLDPKDLWEKSKLMDEASLRLTKDYTRLEKYDIEYDDEDHEILDYKEREVSISHGMKEKPLSWYQKEFENGFVPNKLPKYECVGCDGVANAFNIRQEKLMEYMRK